MQPHCSTTKAGLSSPNLTIANSWQGSATAQCEGGHMLLHIGTVLPCTEARICGQVFKIPLENARQECRGRAEQQAITSTSQNAGLLQHCKPRYGRPTIDLPVGTGPWAPKTQKGTMLIPCDGPPLQQS